MQARDVLVEREDRSTYLLRLRLHNARDSLHLTTVWAPLLENGPKEWLDREWLWEQLDRETELTFNESPEFLVLADEVEQGRLGDLLGVLVTTGPLTPQQASLDPQTVGSQGLIWVEYIAIIPSLRPKCPVADQRKTILKGVGPQLMMAAIERSLRLGCDGRIGLLAEGEGARDTYKRKWKMQELPEAPHPDGKMYPVFFGSSDWARDFLAPKGKVAP